MAPEWLFPIGWKVHLLVEESDGARGRFAQMLIEFVHEDIERQLQDRIGFRTRSRRVSHPLNPTWLGLQDGALTPAAFRWMSEFTYRNDPKIVGIKPLCLGPEPSLAAKYAVVAAIHDALLGDDEDNKPFRGSIRHRVGRPVEPLSPWDDDGMRLDGQPCRGTECIAYIQLKTGGIERLEAKYHRELIDSYLAVVREDILAAPASDELDGDGDDGAFLGLQVDAKSKSVTRTGSEYAGKSADFARSTQAWQVFHLLFRKRGSELMKKDFPQSVQRGFRDLVAACNHKLIPLDIRVSQGQKRKLEEFTS